MTPESGSYQKGLDPQKEEEKFVNIDGKFFLSNGDAIFIKNDGDKRKVL
jgi:hypothetical protein